MAGKKAASHAEKGWAEDDIKYPRKKDICSYCGHRDEVKLSYDMHNYICVALHPCLLRFAKAHRKD